VRGALSNERPYRDVRRETGRWLQMQVLYVEDLANHDDPESCVGIREGVGEALTGEHAGRVLSREKFSSGAPTLWRKAEGNTGRRVMASAVLALRGPRPLARMEATCTGTGRSSGWPFGKVRSGRSALARSYP
jgi:hypothetical protein